MLRALNQCDLAEVRTVTETVRIALVLNENCIAKELMFSCKDYFTD